MNEKLKRFFAVIDRINGGLEVSNNDLSFVLEYSPEIDEQALEDYVKASKDGTATQDQYRTALIEWSKKMQSDPVYKERVVKLYSEQKGQKTADKLAEGISLVLAGTDVANSIKQITEANKAAAQSKRPGRPAVPQRDLLLQQALRQSQEGSFDQGRAVAASRAEIADQYQNDIANAKTASTGQAGAFGAYAQLAADRRNRSALELAPIQDQIKAREQARYDNLLKLRQDETQNMFSNQAQLYPMDLYQYGQDQQTAASLGATGRENLRTGLYNLGGQVAGVGGRLAAERRLRNLKNQYIATHGPETGEKMGLVQSKLYKYTNPQTEFYNDPQSVYDAFNRYNSYE